VNASQNTGRTGQGRTVSSTRRALRVAATTTFVVALSALPAAARQDPGQIDPPSQATTYFCTLERVGTQFVACDNLTGNGVPAPGWVHER
jgi:hypothetical protein